MNLFGDKLDGQLCDRLDLIIEQQIVDQLNSQLFDQGPKYGAKNSVPPLNDPIHNLIYSRKDPLDNTLPGR